MIDLADLYRRFYMWYNDNISHVDFSVIENDIAGKSYNQIDKLFLNRITTIANLKLFENYFTKEEHSKLESLVFQSWEELSLKLAIRGY